MDHQWEDGETDRPFLCPFPSLSLLLFLFSSFVWFTLSVSFPPPPHSLDWLVWVKQANLFPQGLKLPACLFGCGEAQMNPALPSVTTAHVVQIKSKSALFVYSSVGYMRSFLGVISWNDIKLVCISLLPSELSCTNKNYKIWQQRCPKERG